MSSPASPPPATKSPKYLDLAELFRGQIKSGQLKPGDRLPTFVEMRREFGATQATVERFLAVLEREALVQRKPQSGIYVTEPQAATHVVIGVQTIGHLGDTVPFFAQLLEGVRAESAARGAELLILGHEPSPGWERLDGIIGYGERGVVPSEKQTTPLPYVGLISDLGEGSSVLVDDGAGIVQAVDHLVELGHRNIGYLVSQEVPLLEARFDAYQRALRGHGIAPRSRWAYHLINAGSMMLRGHVSMAAWLRDGFAASGITALLVQNDRSAIGAMKSLREAGLRVPQDLSVVGFDSTEECEFCFPRLTSVRVPLREVGARAVDLLISQIETGVLDTVRLSLPVQLEVRDSTAPPRRTGD